MAPRPNESSRASESRAPRSGLQLMMIILLALAAVAIFANYEKAKRREIEKVTITPMASPVPAESR
jgi:hypothetical protein